MSGVFACLDPNVSYQVRLIAYDIMLRCWSLVFAIIDYQLPITNYRLPAYATV